MVDMPTGWEPPAFYKWYFKKERNDSFLVINEQYRESHNIFSYSSDNRQLKFDAFMEEDNGDYVCFAENWLGAKKLHI